MQDLAKVRILRIARIASAFPELHILISSIIETQHRWFWHGQTGHHSPPLKSQKLAAKFTQRPGLAPVSFLDDGPDLCLSLRGCGSNLPAARVSHC